MIRLFLFLLFYVLLFLTCKKEEVIVIPFVPQNCTIGLDYEDKTDEGCVFKREGSSCLPSEEIEEVYNFRDFSRDYIPWSCLAIGERIFFENENGKTTYLTLIQKDHFLQKEWYFTPNGCQAYPNYCYNVEFYSMRLKNNDLNHELEITLQIFVRGNEINHSILSERLSVYKIDSNSSKRNSIFFSPTDTTSINRSNFILYHDEVNIFNESYYDVYSMVDSWTPDREISVFYNKTHGIISFIDENDIQWKIVD